MGESRVERFTRWLLCGPPVRYWNPLLVVGPMVAVGVVYGLVVVLGALAPNPWLLGVCGAIFAMNLLWWLGQVRTAAGYRLARRLGLRGRCPRCGYDLHGTRAARCPECGTDPVRLLKQTRKKAQDGE